MTDSKTYANFLKVATELFPLEDNQHHNLILSEEGELRAMILINEIKEWWYCEPENEDEWKNATKTLTELKDTMKSLIILKNKKQKEEK